MQTLPIVRTEFQFLLRPIRSHLKSHARFHAGQYADQSFGDVVPRSDFTSNSFLAEIAGIQILNRSISLVSNLLCRLLDAISHPQRILFEMFVQDPRSRQPDTPSLTIRNPPQRPPKPQPIKATERALDLLFVM